MSLLSNVEWEPCLLEPRPDPELAGRLRKRNLRVSSSAIDYFSYSPSISESVVGLQSLFMARVDVDQNLLDLIGAVVSQDNSCRYCYAIQRAMMLALGVSERRLHDLAQEVLVGDLSASERAALEFARRMSRANPLPTRADARRLLEAGFSDRQVAEIAGAVALHVLFNRVSTIFALPPEKMERLPQNWFVRLIRPLQRVIIGRMRSRVPWRELGEEEMRGPFEPVVRAVNGLPLAGELRAFLDVILADGALPARAKGLVFAVVGRALGCAYSVSEGTRIAVDGGIDPRAVAEALDHLVSDGLDEPENQLLSVARETVWYQPASIQRRARQLRDRLTVEQFIEAVMAASAANMVCRLGAVVVDR